MRLAGAVMLKKRRRRTGLHRSVVQVGNDRRRVGVTAVHVPDDRGELGN